MINQSLFRMTSKVQHLSPIGWLMASAFNDQSKAKRVIPPSSCIVYGIEHILGKPGNSKVSGPEFSFNTAQVAMSVIMIVNS